MENRQKKPLIIIGKEVCGTIEREREREGGQATA